MRRLSKGIATATAAFAVMLPLTAHAASLEVTEVQHHVRQPQPIAHCRNDGGTCTIERGHTVAASVNSNFGASVGAINAAIGANYEESYTDTTGCERDLAKGERLVMYPSGDFVFFQQGDEKGTAFLPTGVECQTESDWS